MPISWLTNLPTVYFRWICMLLCLKLQLLLSCHRCSLQSVSIALPWNKWISFLSLKRILDAKAMKYQILDVTAEMCTYVPCIIPSKTLEQNRVTTAELPLFSYVYQNQVIQFSRKLDSLSSTQKILREQSLWSVATFLSIENFNKWNLFFHD